MKGFFKGLLLSAAMLLMVVPADAQVTTSSMNGKIVDQAGAPVPGAVVLAVHDPSGTQYYSVTNAEGRYYINGMRPGGPYSVEVSCLGFATAKYTDLTLQLAESGSFDAELVDGSEAVVVADAASKFSAEKTGTATNISSAQITSLPTVSRSITDVTRLSPYGGNGMSFAGADGRTANFTVDGADFNNNFGLSDKLPGGGSPISLDAIEEVQVVISPYDVRQTNFTSGGVNAITKSGTNTFKASAYVYHHNEIMRGNAVEGMVVEKPAGKETLAKDRNTTYGVTLGGPIVKNKLFFFANFEYSKIPTVATRWRGSADGVADPDNYISRTRISDLEMVSNYVKQRYGYDTGSWTDFPAEGSNMKALARIDWNINDANHLAIRYNYVRNKDWSVPAATSMDGGASGVYARISAGSMSFANSMYSQDNLAQSVSLDLNSRISDRISNQFLATFSKFDITRGSDSGEFPFIDIKNDGDNYMSLGYELFSLNNANHSKTVDAKDDITIYAGNHKITAGASYEYQTADNTYMRNGTGYYRYDTLDDFMSGSAPEVVCLSYVYNGEKNPTARVQVHEAGLYAQDEWKAADRFKLTYGLRLDGFFFDNKDLVTNKAIYDLEYDGRHIDTGVLPGNSLSVSPRVGFVWDVTRDKSLKIRGGTGLFTGHLPLVYFTNISTNNGMMQYQAQINSKTAAKMEFTMDNFAGGIVTDAEGKVTTAALLEKLAGLGFPMTVDPSTGVLTSTVDAVDPKLKMPQVWKSSLAVDYTFPTSFPFSITAEGVFNRTINGVCLTDWSVPAAEDFARFNGADNRPIFPAGFRIVPTKAFVLQNTNQGYGWSANVTLNISPVKGLDIMAAYTHTVAKELANLPGSEFESSLCCVPLSEGPNSAVLHNSRNVIPDRFILAATHHDRHGNHYSLIYETRRGSFNYSYMMANDMNGDGYNYDLIYIPTDQQSIDREVRFTSDDDRDRFMEYVHNDPYLSKHQGQYAEAHSLYSPWVHRLDFSYKHDFRLHVAEKNIHILQLCVDIKNLLNLFNSNWGVEKCVNPALTGGLPNGDPRILKYEGVDAEGYATFSTPRGIDGTTQTFVPFHDLGQCWYASIGLRYMFN